MPTTIKGIYENGKIRLLEKPPKNLGTFEVYIQFSQFPSIPKESVEVKPIESKKFDSKKFHEALKNAQGVFTLKDEMNIRKSRLEWDKRLSRMWNE